MSEAVPEPTDDNTPDGTQIPTESGEEENQDQDAGVGGADIKYDEDVFAEGDAE